jgi:hypothetical protein
MRPSIPAVVVPVLGRLRDNRHIIGAVFAGLAAATVIAALFVYQAHAYQSELTASNGEASRLAVSYSKLQDQDFTLGIIPAAPPLAVVEDPSAAAAALPVPKSFTAAFPNGYFTCIDKTGNGNYLCSVTDRRTTTTTTGPHR